MEEKKGFFHKWFKGVEKIKEGVKQQFSRLWSADSLQDEDWEALEEMLVQADLGPNLAMELVEEFQEIKKQKAENGNWQDWLYGKLGSILDGNDSSLFSSAQSGAMKAILLAGINGVGKTTLAGKLARYYSLQGEEVALVAADTFRAAAVDQLEIWAERAGCFFFKGSPGADPGSIIFDGIEVARKKNRGFVIIDTAGRSHVNKNLLAELEKMGKIVQKNFSPENIENLLVIDAMAGQNAFLQAESIGKAIPLNGVILSKWDSQAKGGIVFRIKKELELSIKFLGIGENIEDLQPFDSDQFVKAIVYDEEVS